MREYLSFACNSRNDSIYMYVTRLYHACTSFTLHICIHFRVTRMYGTLRIEAGKARQGKEVVSSQPACWLSSRIDKPSTDEWINKRKKRKRKSRKGKKKKNDGHASTWPHGIVHHWLRCPIIKVIDKWRIIHHRIVHFDKYNVSRIYIIGDGIRLNSSIWKKYKTYFIKNIRLT